MELHEAISERVNRLCKEKGWTKNELVRRSGMNQTTISEINAGRSKDPRISTLYKMARGFDMSLIEFLDDELFANVSYDNEK